ncbi:MAG: response regulator [bacterium]|nr:response regulator [bacterium]
MRMLVVDDREDNRFLVGDVVENAGHTAVLTSNGREACELLDRGEKFDYVISDNNMPEMTGVELLEWMRLDSRTVNVPFILMSAGDPVPLKEICAKFGATFLPKPFSIFRLASLFGASMEITDLTI